MPQPHSLDQSVIEDMAQDLRDSIAFGDSIDTFFAQDGTAHSWLSQSADGEYRRRTGNTPEPGAVATAIYAVLQPEYRP